MTSAYCRSHCQSGDPRQRYGHVEPSLKAADQVERTDAADQTDPLSQNDVGSGRPSGAAAGIAGAAAGDLYSLPIGTLEEWGIALAATDRTD